jgi:hypothetical protein
VIGTERPADLYVINYDNPGWLTDIILVELLSAGPGSTAGAPEPDGRVVLVTQRLSPPSNHAGA